MKENLKVNYQKSESNEVYDVYAFIGDLDKAGLDEVRVKLCDISENFKKDKLVFDFRAMKFTNSEGIGFLMEIHAHLAKLSKHLVIINVNEHVLDVFQAIGFDKIVSIKGDLNEV